MKKIKTIYSILVLFAAFAMTVRGIYGFVVDWLVHFGALPWRERKEREAL